MEWAALITWVVTALFGFTMLAIWLKHGGMRQRGVSKIRPGLLFSHFPLAAAGLVVWIVYLANDEDALAWKAFVVLAVVAVLGWLMFFGLPRRLYGRLWEAACPAASRSLPRRCQPSRPSTCR